MNPSLNDLINFVPKDETEIIMKGETVIQEYLEDTKSRWSNGKYWLGGHIQINLNDVIIPELLAKADRLTNANADVCNSFEMASVLRGKRQFTEINAVVKRYVEVQKQRILCELNKTNLNSDVNKHIVGMI
jgi:hypothetical protein